MARGEKSGLSQPPLCKTGQIYGNILTAYFEWHIFCYHLYINDLYEHLRTNSNDLDGAKGGCLAFILARLYVFPDRFADLLAIQAL